MHGFPPGSLLLLQAMHEALLSCVSFCPLREGVVFAIFAVKYVNFAAYSFPLGSLLLLQAMYEALLSCVSFCPLREEVAFAIFAVRYNV